MIPHIIDNETFPILYARNSNGGKDEEGEDRHERFYLSHAGRPGGYAG
jgi:hypothetical protein